MFRPVGPITNETGKFVRLKWQTPSGQHPHGQRRLLVPRPHHGQLDGRVSPRCRRQRDRLPLVAAQQLRHVAKLQRAGRRGRRSPRSCRPSCTPAFSAGAPGTTEAILNGAAGPWITMPRPTRPSVGGQHRDVPRELAPAPGSRCAARRRSGSSRQRSPSRRGSRRRPGRRPRAARDTGSMNASRSPARSPVSCGRLDAVRQASLLGTGRAGRPPRPRRAGRANRAGGRTDPGASCRPPRSARCPARDRPGWHTAWLASDTRRSAISRTMTRTWRSPTSVEPRRLGDASR